MAEDVSVVVTVVNSHEENAPAAANAVALFTAATALAQFAVLTVTIYPSRHEKAEDNEVSPETSVAAAPNDCATAAHLPFCCTRRTLLLERPALHSRGPSPVGGQASSKGSKFST